MKKYYFNRNQSKKDLIKDYNKMARAANKQLYRLEQYSERPGYENITKYAYAKAMKNIKKRHGDNVRFSVVNEDYDLRRLRGDINAVLEFMNSPSRTLKGIQEIYQRKADTINKKFETNFTWETMINYYSNGLDAKLDKQYGSKTALTIFGEFQKKDVEELEKIYRSLNKNGKLKRYKNKEDLIGNIMLKDNVTPRKIDELI